VFFQQPGADTGILSSFESYAAAGCVLGRVAVAIRDEYRVYAESGEYLAEPSGALLYGAMSKAELPAVGDWVALRVAGPDQGIVLAVLPRKTKFSRRAAGTREDEQVIAANVDTALIMCGLDGDFSLRRMERYLTLVQESGADPVLVLSKADLCRDLEEKLAQAQSVARGKPVIPISSMSEDGMAQLDPYLEPGKTIVLLGSSGVGKTTLLNRLLGEERLRTAPVRESDSRGRHTTTHRELMVLPRGVILIDTPGMRELQLWANRDSLDQTFDEIAEFAAGCRFRDCSHAIEDGCAVREALTAGDLDPARWESYRKLQGEIRHHEVMTDKNAALAQKQQWKVMHKAQKEHYKRSDKWHNSH
jgi:ribosome biogenesis GTPase